MSGALLFCVCVAWPPSRSLWWRGGNVRGQHWKLLSCPPGCIFFTSVLQSTSFSIWWTTALGHIFWLLFSSLWQIIRWTKGRTGLFIVCLCLFHLQAEKWASSVTNFHYPTDGECQSDPFESQNPLQSLSFLLLMYELAPFQDSLQICGSTVISALSSSVKLYRHKSLCEAGRRRDERKRLLSFRWEEWWCVYGDCEVFDSPRSKT